MTYVGQTPALKPIVDWICMYCGKVEKTNFFAMTSINIDGKHQYYLCDECNKEWSEIFDKEVVRKRDKDLFYHKFVAFMKNKETVTLT